MRLVLTTRGKAQTQLILMGFVIHYSGISDIV
jgi:hypothetical protein